MIVRRDNRLFEMLDEMGANVEREMFMAGYTERKGEEEKEPRHIQKRKMTRVDQE
ncbi:hypothetical protein [Klebsiella pneumoniae]|uniref:hypothetical protein n=1 Tax=Klebsiella pneumoniae TaxID=573 RepID=UPI001562FDB5|nr:hypothetical protein [Klebsiella pneumoniae]